MFQNKINFSLPVFIGFLGLVPIILPASLIIFNFTDNNDLIKKILLCYGSVILSFLGGVHWGYALKKNVSNETYNFLWLWSVMPSLVGWASLVFILFDKIFLSLNLIIVGFIISFFVDYKVFSKYEWYRSLRIFLTTFVILSILIIGYF